MYIKTFLQGHIFLAYSLNNVSSGQTQTTTATQQSLRKLNLDLNHCIQKIRRNLQLEPELPSKTKASTISRGFYTGPKSTT